MLNELILFLIHSIYLIQEHNLFIYLIYVYLKNGEDDFELFLIIKMYEV